MIDIFVGLKIIENTERSGRIFYNFESRLRKKMSVILAQLSKATDFKALIFNNLVFFILSNNYVHVLT
jgi:hypothetical protein